MFYILPYKIGSESAKLLAQKLNVKRITGRKTLRRGTVILRWGNSDPLKYFGNIVEINSPSAISRARDKIATFKCFTQNNVPTVEYTTSQSVAKAWLSEDTFVYGRQYTNSSGGEGIKIITADDNYFPSLPLYTKAIPKAHEYRVHVFNGQVIDYTKKKRRTDIEANPYIKNSDNGWVFCRDNVVLPEIVKAAAIKAISSLGLTFGACDILFKERDNKCYVLEVNTAPGIEGTTLEKYTQSIKNYLQRR